MRSLREFILLSMWGKDDKVIDWKAILKIKTSLLYSTFDG